MSNTPPNENAPPHKGTPGEGTPEALGRTTLEDAQAAEHTPRKAAIAANRMGLDYRAEAARLGPPPVEIIDFHTHVNGAGAAPIWREVAKLFGVTKVWTMVRLDDAAIVREALGDMVSFIAFPNFRAEDRTRALREGMLEDIQGFHDRFGARMLKLWNAPRLRELLTPEDGKDLFEFDAPWRVRATELAQSLGMNMMVHVADPDTWFATRYSDASKFGTKLSHYRGLEAMLDRFPMKWVGAHMGGYPEDLDFLDGMLERHANYYIDCSATKWVVRELSRHRPERVRDFFERWQGRLLFGSDIVTTDEHLSPKQGQAQSPMGDLASSPETAWELYASRYHALRTMIETSYEGESNIADPDLKMVDPARYSDMSAPMLRGFALSDMAQRMLYRDTARQVFGA